MYQSCLKFSFPDYHLTTFPGGPAICFSRWPFQKSAIATHFVLFLFFGSIWSPFTEIRKERDKRKKILIFTSLLSFLSFHLDMNGLHLWRKASPTLNLSKIHNLYIPHSAECLFHLLLQSICIDINFSHHTTSTLPLVIIDSTVNSLSYQHSAAVQHSGFI